MNTKLLQAKAVFLKPVLLAQTKQEKAEALESALYTQFYNPVTGGRKFYSKSTIYSWLRELAEYEITFPEPSCEFGVLSLYEHERYECTFSFSDFVLNNDILIPELVSLVQSEHPHYDADEVKAECHEWIGHITDMEDREAELDEYLAEYFASDDEQNTIVDAPIKVVNENSTSSPSVENYKLSAANRIEVFNCLTDLLDRNTGKDIRVSLDSDVFKELSGFWVGFCDRFTFGFIEKPDTTSWNREQIPVSTPLLSDHAIRVGSVTEFTLNTSNPLIAKHLRRNMRKRVHKTKQALRPHYRVYSESIGYYPRRELSD